MVSLPPPPPPQFYKHTWDQKYVSNGPYITNRIDHMAYKIHTLPYRWAQYAPLHRSYGITGHLTYKEHTIYMPHRCWFLHNAQPTDTMALLEWSSNIQVYTMPNRSWIRIMPHHISDIQGTYATPHRSYDIDDHFYFLFLFCTLCLTLPIPWHYWSSLDVWPSHVLSIKLSLIPQGWMRTYFTKFLVYRSINKSTA